MLQIITSGIQEWNLERFLKRDISPVISHNWDASVNVMFRYIFDILIVISNNLQ